MRRKFWMAVARLANSRSPLVVHLRTPRGSGQFATFDSESGKLLKVSALSAPTRPIKVTLTMNPEYFRRD